LASILAVGTAALDIINVVDGYPNEDSEQRAIEQRIGCGGNAANTLSVLSQYGHRCTLAAQLVDEPDGDRIEAILKARRIDLTPCQFNSSGKVPTSYITLNQQNGSRTIIHHRDLDEYPFAAFQQIDLTSFDWLHVEGRNVEATLAMLEHAHRLKPELKCSIEIEKPRPGIEQLFPHTDLLLCSRLYALHRGFESPEPFLRALRDEVTRAELVVAWGDQGAMGLDLSDELYSAPAYPPDKVIDTLAAGDTFNAAFIHARLSGQPFVMALHEGCRVAGEKCGQFGIDNLLDE